MASTDPKPIAVRVLFSGRVQGVGFRATAIHIAQRYPVTGWVRNLMDGRVELLAEGTEAGVNAFLGAIRGHWGRAIHDEQSDIREPTGKFRGFDVAY